MSTLRLSSSQKRALAEMNVQAVYLFGSRAQGKEGPLSDYDYAVLMSEGGHTRGDDLYFRLYTTFGEISPRTLENDVIDIIFLRDIGLELRFHVIRYGRVLLDSDPKERLRFEAETMLLYCDYRPILDRFDRAILQSL